MAVLLFGMMHAQDPIKLPIQPSKPIVPHVVGEIWVGGIVILTYDDLHGTIVKASDLKGPLWGWYAAKEIMKLDCVHSTEGANFSDWRLPSPNELNRLYYLKDIIGGFSRDIYCSS